MRLIQLAGIVLATMALSSNAAIVKEDYQIDAVDPGIKLFVRSKMSDAQRQFTNDNIVLFVHGATFPSTP